MSRVLYLDCFSGISGDMFLGACLDAGLPLPALEAALGSLAVSGFAIRAHRVLRGGVSATKFDVVEHPAPVPPLVGGAGRQASALGAADPRHGGEAHQAHHGHADRHADRHDEQGHDHDEPRPTDHHHHDHDHGHPHQAPHHHAHRSLPEIRDLIDRSALSTPGRARAKALFQRLAEAEAAIHDMPVDRVHLHEVGALDSIIDVVGAVFAMEWWDASRVICSPLNVGGGTVRSAHGVFPVPAPATVRLLHGVPVYGGLVQKELVTPTGALIATDYASEFGPVPSMVVQRVGYGAGERDNPETPNVLRLMVGEQAGGVTSVTSDEKVIVLECEIDDMNPQIFGVVMERLYAAGALDVYYVSVQMKKNRPGTLLTVVARPERRESLADVIFRETTTIGLRYHEMCRERLEREVIPVETPLGVVHFKVARRDGRVLNVAPEFDDCARLAAAHGRPVKDIQALAVQCYGAGGREHGREL